MRPIEYLIKLSVHSLVTSLA